jgi:hypothetical protein
MKIRISQRRPAFSEAFSVRGIPSRWLRLGVVVSLVAVMSFADAERVFAGVEDPSPTIRVRVNNYAKASPAIIARAEREAGRILGEAGLLVVWLDCPMKPFGGVDVQQHLCLEPLEATDIVLRVLSEPTQDKFQDTVFGFAVVPILASVYYDYALRIAKKDNAEFEVPIILGSVIAHEVGHLLLGLNSHTSAGVMQPRWERKQVRQAMTGVLLFTHEQSKLVQAEAKRRMSLEAISLNQQRLGRVEQQVITAAHSGE